MDVSKWLYDVSLEDFLEDYVLWKGLNDILVIDIIKNVMV